MDSSTAFTSVTLKYPGIIGKPIILVVVECLLTGKQFAVPMLIDTDADHTCFPASFASFFGHDNKHPLVITESCCGVGGDSVTYIHSVQLSLLHPKKATPSDAHIVWTSSLRKAAFVEKLSCTFGLIGMDLISKWKQLIFKPEKNGTTVIIRI